VEGVGLESITLQSQAFRHRPLASGRIPTVYIKDLGDLNLILQFFLRLSTATASFIKFKIIDTQGAHYGVKSQI